MSKINEGIFLTGRETKQGIIAIGQQLIERAEDICNDLTDVHSITINAEIVADKVVNFDVIKNYNARFKEEK